jgi:hypothetical protein
MSGAIRRIPAILGQTVASVLVATRALGDAVLDLEELDPLIVANNLADPQLKLAGAIIMLFAGSLSILVVGYVLDSTRPPSRSSR